VLRARAIGPLECSSRLDLRELLGMDWGTAAERRPSSDR
jgi:hypothetical protein